ncbi:MAG: imelysin family protein [Rhodobacteraceae bacterium]|nr:imelysin family protein [Paracoccaceae bacterium]
MKRLFGAAALALLPFAVLADRYVDRAIDEVIMPNLADFSAATQRLSQEAADDCGPQSAPLLAAWGGAMDAWLAVQEFRFGPLQEFGRRDQIAFWPDVKGFRPRALHQVLTGRNTLLETPENMANEAISVRGIYAIEALLYDPRFNSYGLGDPACDLMRLIANDLLVNAQYLETQWQNGFADTLKTAGEPGNTRYLSVQEARQALFTGLTVSMQFDILERLGLPIGEAERARPLRAEGRLSERSQHNLSASLAAHLQLAETLSADPAQAARLGVAFAALEARITALDDADFSGVSEPNGRFALTVLATDYQVLWDLVNRELGATLGVQVGLAGFDGD